MSAPEADHLRSGTMSRYRWALRPWWIVSHLFVLACVVAFVNLGLWQLRRLDERKTHNALIAAREAMAPVEVETLVRPDATGTQVDDTVFRRVTVTGTYLPDEQVLIRNRTFDGAPGYEVVTPVRLADGTTVVVNRGWIPLQMGDDASASTRRPTADAVPTDQGYAPPPGTVTVTGLVATTQVQEGLGVSDPADGHLDAMARVDVARIQHQMPGAQLLPVYVTLATQDPAQGPTPFALPAPVLDEGPHLGYAGQWFIFAGLTCIVYPLLLRRTARNKEQDAREAEWYDAPSDTEPLVSVGPGPDAGSP